MAAAAAMIRTLTRPLRIRLTRAVRARLTRAVRARSRLFGPATARPGGCRTASLRLRFSSSRRGRVELWRRLAFRCELTRALRLATVRGDPLVPVAEAFSDPFFCARRARFQALRATAASLRARLPSRLASFRRLRARFSSSFAMRTRCLATSACSRTRWSGSAVECCALPVFFIRRPRSERPAVSHKPPRVSSPGSYPQILCITMWTAKAPSRKG